MTTFVVDGLTLYAWPESWAAPGDGVLRVTVGCPPLTGDDSVVDPPPQPASAASIAEIIDIRIFMGDAPLLRQSTKPITRYRLPPPSSCADQRRGSSLAR